MMGYSGNRRTEVFFSPDRYGIFLSRLPCQHLSAVGIRLEENEKEKSIGGGSRDAEIMV
jgi:hypothetical protein